MGAEYDEYSWAIKESDQAIDHIGIAIELLEIPKGSGRKTCDELDIHLTKKIAPDIVCTTDAMTVHLRQSIEI